MGVRGIFQGDMRTTDHLAIRHTGNELPLRRRMVELGPWKGTTYIDLDRFPAPGLDLLKTLDHFLHVPHQNPLIGKGYVHRKTARDEADAVAPATVATITAVVAEAGPIVETGGAIKMVR